MNDNEKILVLKISNKTQPIPFSNPDELRERAAGYWLITLATLNEVQKAILLFEGQVLASYAIGDTVKIKRVEVPQNVKRKPSPRIKLDLEQIKTEFDGTIIAYKAKNPVSIATVGELKKLMGRNI